MHTLLLRERRVTEGGGRVRSAVPCGEGLRPNGGHSPYFAFSDDTYRHGRTTRTDPHGPSRTLTDLTDLTDTHGHSRTLTDTHGTHGLSRTLTDSHGLSRILTDLTDSHGFSRILMDSHVIALVHGRCARATSCVSIISRRCSVYTCLMCVCNMSSLHKNAQLPPRGLLTQARTVTQSPPALHQKTERTQFPVVKD